MAQPNHAIWPLYISDLDVSGAELRFCQLAQISFSVLVAQKYVSKKDACICENMFRNLAMTRSIIPVAFAFA